MVLQQGASTTFTCSHTDSIAYRGCILGIHGPVQDGMSVSWDLSAPCQIALMHTGRKKRRAARGRTDVGEQPYEDPNMQMVLHQPQDSFLQPFMQMMQGPIAERPRIEEPSNSQTSSPTSLKDGSPEPWEELTGQSRPQYQNEELGQTFSGLKLGGLDSRVPSSVTIRLVFVAWTVGTSSLF